MVWVREAMLPLLGVTISDGRRTVPFVTSEILRQTQIQPWSTDPNKTREQLLRHRGFELRRGREVIAVLTERNRVMGVRARDVSTGEESEVFAQYTIGDDGVHSLVRESCNIRMKTRLLPLDFLCFSFDWPVGLPPATARAWLNVKESAFGVFSVLAVPLPERKGVGIVAVRTRVFDDISAQDRWDQFCSVDRLMEDVVINRRFPQDFVRIRRSWGHASRYGAEGAILMGDAAHPVSPAGGQGANMSVADACVLAEIALR